MEKMPTLWDISDELTAYNDLIMMDEGEISEDHEALENQMMELLKNKTDGCYEYIERIQGLIKLANQKKSDVQKFIERKESELERFNFYILSCIEKSGEEKFTGSLYEIKMKKPSKKIIIDDPSKIDIKFQEKKPAVEEYYVVDKAMLKKAFKNGEVKEEGFRLVDGKKSIIIGFIKKDKKKKESKNA